MAKLETLVAGVRDERLRAQIATEVKALKERTRFGLVYERHLPETVIVGDTDAVEIGAHVRRRQTVEVEEDFRVVGMTPRTARLLSLKTGEESTARIKDLLAIKRFGDPAHAGLESLGAIRRSPSRPAHAVIEGENFHTLQALALVYENQVDCIYIDPPYNTGGSI